MSNSHSVLAKIGKRFVNSAFVLLVLTVVVFAAMRAIPGDPVETIVGVEAVSEETLAALRKEMGLDQSYVVQYFTWLGNLLQGDMGQSLQNHEPVLPILLDRLKATAELAFLGVLIGAMVGVTAGTIAGMTRGSFFDTLVMFVTLSGISIPVFWFGTILIVVLLEAVRRSMGWPLPVIAVSWGFRSVQCLRDAGAVRIAANPQELLAMLEAL